MKFESVQAKYEGNRVINWWIDYPGVRGQGGKEVTEGPEVGEDRRGPLEPRGGGRWGLIQPRPVISPGKEDRSLQPRQIIPPGKED